MIPRRHWAALALLGLPWGVVLFTLLTEKQRGGFFTLGESPSVYVSLVLFAYALEAACCTWLIGALNWKQRRPRAETIAYGCSALPSLLGIFAAYALR
jgi:hypothetical protein